MDSSTPSNLSQNGPSHHTPNFSPEEWLERLEDKYAQTGQNMESYLEGLLYTDYLNYWDYIHTDTLLSLQITRTQFPDEMIFIVYHQISELTFKMILSELGQLAALVHATEEELIKRVNRVNRYMQGLVSSFEVMSEGMDQSQFMRFRMALLPASGFQSAQFRMIEIASTDFANLVIPSVRAAYETSWTAAQLYDLAYWKRGATELKSGSKTLTLKRFEDKYGQQLIAMIGQYAHINLARQVAKSSPHGPGQALREALRSYDQAVNVEWRLVHFKSASKYLHQDPVDIAATGGTNWQKYLPPNFQRNYFFPDLWSEEEKEGWGLATPGPLNPIQDAYQQEPHVGSGGASAIVGQ